LVGEKFIFFVIITAEYCTMYLPLVSNTEGSYK